jgi:hypothetical protein
MSAQGSSTGKASKQPKDIAAKDIDLAELVRMLAGQLAFHQEQLHKVNARAIFVFLGAAASAIGLTHS